jgi:hypothetical protein
MEITKALCLSTAHISELTNDKLHRQYLRLPLTKWHHPEYGWFISTHNAMEQEANIPRDLFLLLCRAIMEDCTFLRLDRDGPIVEGIETYEW